MKVANAMETGEMHNLFLIWKILNSIIKIKVLEDFLILYNNWFIF